MGRGKKKLFENYPDYIKDVVNAAKGMSSEKKSTFLKVSGGTAVAIACTALTLGGTVIASSQMQAQEALAAVQSDLGNHSVEIEVEGDTGDTVASLLSDSPNNLSSHDEAAIAEQVKNSMTPDAMAHAHGTMVDNNTIEVDITTAENIPVTVTIKIQDDNTYKIEKIVARLDAETASEKKKQTNNQITTDGQKQTYAKPLSTYTNEGVYAAAGLPQDADDASKAAAHKRMSVLANDLVAIIPNGYETQETEKPESINVEKGVQASENIPDEKKNADSVEPYIRSWRSNSNSTINARSEDLGSAFTSMNGYDGVNKMLGYWKETSQSVATGASQTLKNEQEGYVNEVFYDPTSGMWGYFGHVVFTDGSRDVTYNRVVFIDELADQMITVSYRHDSAANANDAMTLDAFKALFMNAPVSGEAKSVYDAGLEQIQILPGEDKTVADKKKAEVEAAAQAQKQAQAAETQATVNDGKAAPNA